MHGDAHTRNLITYKKTYCGGEESAIGATPRTEFTETEVAGDNTVCWKSMYSYYVQEGHGYANDCHHSLQTAKDRCLASRDCGAITSQSNVGGGCYRVVH